MSAGIIRAAPDGAEVRSEGFYYKRGRFGLSFVFVDGEWIRTTRDVVELQARADRKPASAAYVAVRLQVWPRLKR